MKVTALVIAAAILGLASPTLLATERCTGKDCKVSSEERKRVAQHEGDRRTQAKIDAIHRKQRKEVEARSMCQWGSASC